MKAIKIAAMLVMLLSLTGIYAQTEEQTKTTTTYTVNVQTKDGIEIPYRITVKETIKSNVNFAQEDREKIDQTRIDSPEYVTKVIHVDNDSDNTYNRYIVLRYLNVSNNSFALVPTNRGFMVNVDQKSFEYKFGEGLFFSNYNDAEYFFIDEFSVN